MNRQFSLEQNYTDIETLQIKMGARRGGDGDLHI